MESVTFIGHKVLGSHVVARFLQGDRQEMVLSRPDCELRLMNFRMNGDPCEQTEKALESWPEEK